MMNKNDVLAALLAAMIIASFAGYRFEVGTGGLIFERNIAR